MQVNSAFHDTAIICFSLARWDAPISSPAVSLAKELSGSHRVFFIEHPYSYKDYLRERKSAKIYRDDGVTVITPPLTYPINFLPAGKWYDLLSRVNNNILLRTLRKIIRENNIGRYVFMNFFDPFFLGRIPEDIRPLKYVYQCMDDVSQVAYTKKHGLKLEEEIIRHADYTLCTSRELKRLKSHLSRQVFFYPNAADTDLFGKAHRKLFERPADMDFPGKKIIGFTGSIEYRTDFELLGATARHHHDKVLYLVGPVYGDEHIRMGLTDMSNVVFAGPKNISRLPQYLQYFDCAIIPYKINTLTRSIYPLKINEYLAAGKPVVATAFSEDIRSFRDIAFVVDTHEEFIVAIDKAIAEDDTQKEQQRVAAAASNSWAARVEQFWEIVSR